MIITSPSGITGSTQDKTLNLLTNTFASFLQTFSPFGKRQVSQDPKSKEADSIKEEKEELKEDLASVEQNDDSPSLFQKVSLTLQEFFTNLSQIP
jgi:hypothetical protein